jgi:hypothetical protein
LFYFPNRVHRIFNEVLMINYEECPLNFSVEYRKGRLDKLRRNEAAFYYFRSAPRRLFSIKKEIIIAMRQKVRGHAVT